MASSSSSTTIGVVHDHAEIDALPYLDKEYDALKLEVDLLIKSEMTTLASELQKQQPAPVLQQYLDKLGPSYEPFADHPVLQAEFKRVAAKQPLQAIDLARYQVSIVLVMVVIMVPHRY